MTSNPKNLCASVWVAAAATGMLFAQAAPRATHPLAPDQALRVRRDVGRLRALLNLSRDQQQQAARIYSNAAMANAAMRPSLRAARASLASATKANNTLAIIQASNTIGDLRSQLATHKAQVQAAFVKILTPEQETEYQQLVSQPRNRSRGRPAGGHFATDSHQARTPVAREDKTGNCPPGVQDFVAHPECCGQAEAARRQSMYGGRIPCFGEEVNAEAALHDGDRTRKDRDRCAQLFKEHRSDHFGNGTAVQEGTSSDEEGGGRSRKWIGSHCGLEDDERHWRHATDPSRERRSRT